MATLPMKVKAIFAYSSEHDDDLKFVEGQMITVTEEEDNEWYVGEYIDSTGVSQSGLFPKNFVERYEPAPPPRPTRAHKPKALETPAPEPSSPQLPEPSKPRLEEIKTPEAETAPQPAPALIEERPAPILSPKPASKQFEAAIEPPSAPKPVQATSAKGPPPPVSDKPSASSFKDRLKAFNQAGGPPPVPFKPKGSENYIRKPFVAPPPSRSAFVPAPREAPPPKVYRREEDPEIAQRRADDEAAAQKAGLAPGEGEEEDVPKPVSLKERIALLQQQQLEQANRGASTHKKKPAKPLTKRTESQEVEAVPDRDSIDTDQERTVRTSSDLPREPPARRPSRGPKVSEIPPREPFSDGNEADQSAAGETTEDNEPESSTEDDFAAQRHNQAPMAQPDIGGEEGLTEEGEEEDEESEDEETRRKRELRERMAKISGQGGFNPMFGGGGMGISMPGMGGAPPKKKKPAPEQRSHEKEEESPAAPSAPRVPMPGIAIPGMSRTLSAESATTVGRDGENEYEESPRQTSAPFSPKELVPASATMDRGAPPPVPGGRPSLEGRPVPLPPASMESPSAGSESDDEMPQTSTGADLPIRAAPPPVPQSPVETRSSPRSSLDRGSTEPASPIDRRASRLPPPIPVLSSTPSSTQTRPPPPPPPSQAPTRQTTSDSLHKRALGQTGEDGSEYEGDYDTDIAPGAHHKDALKSHARDSSLDDSTAPADFQIRSPPVGSTPFSPPPTSAPRAVPPLPPTGPPRKSGESSRAFPPAPVGEGQYDEDGEDYDPYKYSPGVAAAAAASRSPPARQAPPPFMPPPAPVHYHEDQDDDEPYSPPTRQSTDRPRKSMDRAPPPLPTQAPPPPMPPQAPPQHDRAPPPLPPQVPPPSHFEPAPPLPAGRAPMRPSMDQERSFNPSSRISAEPGVPRLSSSGFRPDVVDPGFIAHEVDMGEASKWWSQPNLPPPSIQGRNDILYEIEELPRSSQGGQTVISKDVFILYQDYSQTVISARFDASNADDVSLEQKQEGPPGKLRQDQLENSWNRFGLAISKLVDKMTGSVAINDGSSHALVIELLRGMPAALPPVGTRAYGALVYANLGNASVQQFDEIRPGDIVSFRNAKFSGKHSGALHSKYSLDVAIHVGVVTEWDGTKKKVRVAEQGRDVNGEGDGGKGTNSSKDKKKKKGKIEVESYRLGDLRSGEVRVWRVVGREFVGWRS
ncbi:hypothetical protein E6O75_ATG05277 [Venturia nashicola]|uniref:SH3 domain-containing protein n=1 Tax=Venturia nashicola TaxID=86259 RepID=A0A4Z1NWH2_9PEZI|nr:hypothetical protein E6O75_ATG05277 [Venturia nashicola]